MQEKRPLYIYNTLTRAKEEFAPLNAPHVGMYVCGPTVYGDAHLGHARPAITFDLLYRYLMHLGYKVRYVRNITDVGHLEHDADEGEDKVAKKARLEQLEPMEVVQYYLRAYQSAMDKLGVLPPSIEPMASGHIIEQIQLTQQILDAGYAYQSNGSVYFDVRKYAQDHAYGQLSGRSIDDMLHTTRELDGQAEKRFPLDFAVWKRAEEKHIMRWPSPWGEGFPGWHCECSAMSRKYLGDSFDIHGGGMDLVFPHHEAEIAQSTAAQGGKPAVRYWMHNNMITIEGKKMGKSLNNFVTLDQFFSGSHEKLAQAYSPMTIRFFILGAHYRSTVDFTNEALQASEKGMLRLLEAANLLDSLKPGDTTTVESIRGLAERCYTALSDDLNSAIVLAELFEASKAINAIHAGQASATAEDLDELRRTYRLFLFDLLGIRDERASSASGLEAYAGAVDLLLDIRATAKANKDWTTSDRIRNELTDLGFVIKDTKEGAEWSLK